MQSAVAGYAPRKDLAPLGNKAAQFDQFLVIYARNFISTEITRTSLFPFVSLHQAYRPP
jgi:hypothetical protein